MVGELTPRCINGDSSNPFVERAVEYAVAAAKTIIIDNNKKEMLEKLLLQGVQSSKRLEAFSDISHDEEQKFVSFRKRELNAVFLIEARGLPLMPEVLASLPPFSAITFNSDAPSGALIGEKCKPEVAKTGLGSSAAMTTSVVGVLLHYLGVVNLPPLKENLTNESRSDLDLVHIIAQSAHCIAQGKVGSGFDVSAAVYGSQRYVRFSPGILSSLQVLGGYQVVDCVSNVLQEKWDHERVTFTLPPLMTLLLGEPGTGGSSTPSMVGLVKQWQKSHPHKSLETWNKLAAANSELETQLKMLSKLAEEHSDAYKCVLDCCSKQKYEKWMEQALDNHQKTIVESLIAAREAFLVIRFHMQLMGKESGVPIEPESQTVLLDATMNVEGVLFAGVPGAGGFDAIFAVTLGESSNNVTNTWSSLGVLPLLVRDDPRGVSLEEVDPRAREMSSAISSIHI
ncbi:hypothetical protein QJS10_CPA01g02971 [Acorus calamus]|uniref:phosphomevalonate kinase n=1 Tax=Acorus calamus TaxID=4465 RepID=A0AAV9FUE0_ACOCL|nr:hypothetical protein QJS10_CPA01g02971 [Acorus calamus]